MNLFTPEKKCPFCGYAGNRIVSEQVGDPPHWEYWVMCDSCGACGPNDLGESGAVAMWDLRREEYPANPQFRISTAAPDAAEQHDLEEYLERPQG